MHVHQAYVEQLETGRHYDVIAYRGTRVVRALLASRDAGARHRAVEDALDGYHRRHGAGSRTGWADLLPARAWRLGIPG